MSTTRTFDVVRIAARGGIDEVIAENVSEGIAQRIVEESEERNGCDHRILEHVPYEHVICHGTLTRRAS